MSKPYNKRKPTGRKPKPSNNVRKSNLTKPKNNIRKAQGNKPNSPVLETKRIKDGLKNLKRDLAKARNKTATRNRRTYIARTTAAGVDEFNDTKLRARKGGSAHSSKDLAKFNKGKKIKGSAKGVGKGQLATTALAVAEHFISNSGTDYGNKVKKAREQMEKTRRDALEYVRNRLRRKNK